MADGSVKIDVGLNLAKAEKDLEKLKAKIEKTEAQLNADSQRKSAIESQLGKAGAAADEAKKRVIELKEELANTRSRDEKAALRTQLAEATEEQRILTRESDKLNDEYVKVSASVKEGEKNLAEMKDQAGELVREINTARPGEALAAGFEKARKSFVKFLKYAIGIRSAYVLFRRLRSAIADAVKQYAEYNYQTKFALAELKATKSAISAAFGTWIANALPYVQKIANWMLEAANAASKFVAILSGRSTYKKAVIDQNEIAASLAETADEEEEVAEEAKEAKKQLMGFDELNILSDDSSADKKDKDKKDKIDKTELDGFKLVEEAIDAFDGSFLNNLALSFKDVLFEWKDLNPEQIAKKIIAGLGAVLGAALGISLGIGPGGVILMTIAGLIVGLVFDAMIFDHDGRLDKTELVDMLLVILNAIVGGIAGFLFTKTFKGAMIGATIAAGLTLAYKAIDMKTDGALSKNGIASGLTALLAGVLGLQVGKTILAGTAFGGPVGALIGIVVGVALTLVIESIKARAAARDAFYDSDFGKSVQALKEKLQETLQTDTDLRVRINSITGEIDENTLADLGAAQALIDKIFTLDAKENKTTEEAALLKTQIEALNSLGLPGLQIAFDETTGHVTTTRQEVQALYNDLLRQYQIEAMKESYIESFKAQYDSTENVKKATEDATRATSDYETALGNLKTAQTEYSDAVNAKLEENTKANRDRLEAARDALLTAEEGVEATKKNAENAKATLETAMNTADLAAEKVNNIGEALAGLVTEGTESGKNAAEGFSQGISENAALGADEAKKMGEAALDALATALDAHSPSRKTEEQGQNAVDGFKNAIESGTPTVVQAAHSMMEQLIREYTEGVQRLKQVMNFTWSIPRPKIPKISWNIKNVRYGNGQSVSIPEFFVNWYAKGGVFDFPQLIGVGENGKEAVVPLEKNTEWMQTVAEGLIERMSQSRFMNDLASAFASTPLPAMAGGGIVPPNAVSGGGISREDMQMAIERGVYNAIMALGGMPKSRGGMTLDVNGREFARAIYSDMQAVGNEHGISLIES